MNSKIVTGLLSLAAGTLLAPAAHAAEIKLDGGIKAKDADKGYAFELDGRVMWDFAVFDNDDNGGQNVSGSEFRRIRLTAKGSAFGWNYVIQPDFAGDGVTMKDVYIGKGLGRIGKLKLGQFKVPFGLEELTSSKYITIQERSAAAGIASSHQMGVGLFGHGNGLSWGAAAYNLDSNDDDVNNGTGLGGRLTFAPVDTDTVTVHLGAALAQESVGKSADDGDNSRFRVRYRAAGHLSDESRPTLIDLNNGRRSDVGKVGIELAGVFGPVSLQSEYAVADAEDGVDEGETSAYYLQLSGFLTGERRPYKAKAGTFDKVKPKNPGGAWELALRFDHAEGEYGPIGGVLDSDTELDIVTVGVNWYANANVRVMLNYWTAEITDQLSNTTTDEPKAITGRVQIHF